MKRVVAVVGILMAAAAVAAFVAHRARGDGGAPSEFTPDERALVLQHALGDPPRDPSNAFFENPDAARLGQRLFFDPGFSRSGTVSCATCHVPERSFTDGLSLPERFPVDRNVPSLWNVAYNRWFFWDGRADSLWSQALQPIENPREHGFTRLESVRRILAVPALREGYARVFGPLPDPSDRAAVDRAFANLGKAIAAYERNLVSRRSPFDLFAEGLRTGDAAKMAALSPAARQGLKLFVGRANCRLCHSGPNFTDGEFHNIGIAPLRGSPSPGRFAAIDEVRRDPYNMKGPFSDDPSSGAKKLDYLAKLQETWGQFKTPTLRNVAKSAPYMHQGQFKSLQEVVRFYSTLQGRVPAGHSEPFVLVPLMLSPDELAALVAFLESLTDESIDARLLKPPE